MLRPLSHAAFARAKRLIPGGVNSPARAFGGVGGEPLFIARGEGAYLYDLDGGRFIDYIGSWGPMILGHGHPRGTAALEAAIRKGTSFGAPTEAESDLADLIVAAMPAVERVRLVSSGTEATMSAIRLARGFTGRDVIAKFAGNYHGHVDSLLVAAGSSAATLGVPNSPGVTDGTTQDTLVLRYNDIAGLEAAFAAHGARIAGVILEPVVGNMGVVIPTPAFLQALRELTHRHGALLIFDEVMTGFRVAYNGAQSLYNIRPDLTTLGKIVGGGLPVGAYGGRADIMDHILPAGKVFQAGTLSGNPLATAAGIATLRELRAQTSGGSAQQSANSRQPAVGNAAIYNRLESLSARLEAGLHAAAQAAGIEHVIQRVGSMLTFFFQAGPVTDWESASRSDTQRFARYFWGLIERGAYMPCSQYEALFVSAAHTEADIDATVAAAKEVFATL